ncbi:MAG: SCO family protein [Thermodesulfobacteriota bacterium]
MYRSVFFIIVLFILLAPLEGQAEYGRTPVNTIDPAVIKIDEKTFLGAKLDGEYLIKDAEGKEFQLKEIFGKPAILVLSYFNCDGVCPTINMDLKARLDSLEVLRRGEDYRVLTLSFDRADGVENARMFSEKVGIGKSGGWRVGVMEKKEDIDKLTASVGFKFFWSMRDRTFIHPNVFIFLSPEGRVVRYLYGANMDKTDIKVAIAEAGFGNPVNSMVREINDLLLIACYSYNYKEGKYTLNYPLFIAAGSLFSALSLTVLGLVIYKRKKGKGVK